MRQRLRPSRLVPPTAMIALAGAVAVGAAPADQVIVADGTIAAVNGNTLTIAAGGAEKVVRVEAATLILSRQPATLGAIKPGDALGVAAKRGADGSLVAISISIFSPSSGTGHARVSGRWSPETS